MRIKISDIIVSDGLPAVKNATVVNLAGSIKTMGLIQPITTRCAHSGNAEGKSRRFGNNEPAGTNLECSPVRMVLDRQSNIQHH